MKLSFTTLGCPRWSWTDIVVTARDLGYLGVEVRGVGRDMSVPSVPEFSKEKLPETIAHLNELGIAIPCLDSDCCLHEADNRQKTIDEGVKYIDLARAMRSPYIRILGCHAVPYPVKPVDALLVKDTALHMAEYAAKKGIVLLFETNGVWANSQDLAKLVSDINHPNIAVLWDTHHPFRYYGENPFDTMHTLRPYIKHVHFKDSIMKDGAAQYQMLGYGDVPMDDIMAALKEMEYDGFYSMEWLKRYDDALEEPGIAFAHAVSYMSRYNQ